MTSLRAYTADRIFTGDEWITNQAIIIENEFIADILPVSSLSTDMPLKNYGEFFLAPAFIDLQIYGAHEKLFAVFPEVESLRKLNEYCRVGGAAFCMPTVATNTYDIFYKCIDAVKEYISGGGKGILGLHIEGPWINKIKRGAHIERLIHAPTPDQAKELFDYGKGVIKMITVAPEICNAEVIELANSYNIVVFAGHSDATYGEATKSFVNGVHGVTHLYNAMSPLHHREPGLVGAVLDHASVPASIIPDGHHVDFSAIRIAKKLMQERLFVITDAVTETRTGEYKHKQVGDKYEAEGILSGSSLNMARAFFNLVKYVGIDVAEALRMCSLYPAEVIKMAHQLGRMAPGYQASIIAVDEKKETAMVLDT